MMSVDDKKPKYEREKETHRRIRPGGHFEAFHLVREFRHDEHGPPPERLLGPEDIAVDVVPNVQHLRAGGHAEHGVEVPVAPALIRLRVRARGIPVLIYVLLPPVPARAPAVARKASACDAAADAPMGVMGAPSSVLLKAL